MGDRSLALIALVSAYMISFRDLRVNLESGEGTVIAALLALSAGLFWGSSTAISKYVLNKVSFLTATALRFLLAPVFAFLLILGFGQTGTLFTLTVPQWQSLLLITFSTGMVALAVYYYGLKRTPARVTTLYELVWPASAILIDYFYFHKSLSLTQIIGVIILLTIIIRVTRIRK